jgi:transcriptional regulator with XRE-family HTH domain
MPRRRTSVEVCPHCNRRIRPDGAEIRAVRELVGLTTARFAEKLGVSASHVVFLESNRRSMGSDLVPRYYAFARRLLADAHRKLAATSERVAGE